MTDSADAKQTDISTAQSHAHTIHTDVLIIGAGLAGLSTALALPKSLSVTVLSKAELQACSSHYAQGGIAASLAADDSVDDHIADTLVAGAGLCALDNTASILSAGQQAVQWLCEQGVPFTLTQKLLATKDSDDNAAKKTAKLSTAALHLTQEGGHGRRRVAHADDATGRYVMETITQKAQAASNITILDFHEAVQLLVDKDSPRCQGAIGFDHKNQRQKIIYSQAVVMASGGLGQLFARASAPNVCVGDGIMMAWQAGCRLANLEFVQFHPTGLALGESSFLISEALRGEGGRLYCPLTGKRFMLEVDTRGELAPRDIVARAIAEQIRDNGLGYVHLDVSHLPATFLREHFPQIYQTLLALGVDITIDAIPVAPTAHYSCGGIVTCAQGLTDVLGLYAAGEVAYTGLHGANRLASNSLLECIVVGHQIAKHLPSYLANSNWTPPTLTDIQYVCYLAGEGDETNRDIKAASFSAIQGRLKTTLSPNDIDSIATALKALMSAHMGIVREAASLQQALSQLKHWQQRLGVLAISDTAHWQSFAELKSYLAAHKVTHQQLSASKLARQLQLATFIVHSALQRQESRGGHYRQDYPSLAQTPLVSVIRSLNETKSSHKVAHASLATDSVAEDSAYADSLAAFATI